MNNTLIKKNKTFVKLPIFGGISVEIDNYLVEIIIILNKKGYYTQNCCSGLIEEHKEEDKGQADLYEEQGFISFYKSSSRQQIILKRIAILSNLKPCIAHTIACTYLFIHNIFPKDIILNTDLDKDLYVKNNWDRLLDNINKYL